MSTTAHITPVSTKPSWTGRILYVLIVLFMLFDGVSKLMRPASVVRGFAQSGWAASLVVPVGVLALVCAILYAIPRTSILGAILLTAYLGGATAANLRAGLPIALVLTPVVFGVLVWLALFLREPRLRALLPMKK